jgi:CBS domain-containing protein
MTANPRRLRPTDSVRSLDWGEPIFVSGDVSLQTVASTLDRCHVGAVVLSRREGDAAIVSERDIVAAVAAGAALDQVRAGELATRELISADPGERIIDVAQRLIDEGVRHVALVDRDDVVGVLSIRDLFGVLVAEFRDDPAT